LTGKRALKFLKSASSRSPQMRMQTAPWRSKADMTPAATNVRSSSARQLFDANNSPSPQLVSSLSFGTCVVSTTRSEFSSRTRAMAVGIPVVCHGVTISSWSRICDEARTVRCPSPPRLNFRAARPWLTIAFHYSKMVIPNSDPIAAPPPPRAASATSTIDFRCLLFGFPRIAVNNQGPGAWQWYRMPKLILLFLIS